MANRALNNSCELQEKKKSLELLIKNNPSNYQYAWQRLALDYSSDTVSAYLISNQNNQERLEEVKLNAWFTQLEDVLPDEMKIYTKLISEYVENRAQINGTNGESNSNPKRYKGNGDLGWSALLLVFVLFMSGRMLYLICFRESISIINIVVTGVILLLLVALLIKAVLLKKNSRKSELGAKSGMNGMSGKSEAIISRIEEMEKTFFLDSN